MSIIFYFSFVNFLVDLGTNSTIIDFPSKKHPFDFSSRTSAPCLAHFSLMDFPAKKSFLISLTMIIKLKKLLFHEQIKICLKSFTTRPRPPFVHFF